MHGLRYRFAAFELDPVDRTLSCDGAGVRLSGKPFELLLLLARAGGELVTREDAIAALWPDTKVHENSLAVVASGLRQALLRACPTALVETVPRRGYRLTVTVREAPRSLPAPLPASGPSRELVGREHELTCLRQSFDAALSGRGALVWIAGEPGIGKTTLLERAHEEFKAREPLSITGSGRCMELHAGSEAFSVFIAAIGEILRGPWREPMRSALISHCPEWCWYYPGEFAGNAAVERARREGSAAAPASSMRRLSDALFAVAARAPLLLLLEDVQWLDEPSADLLRILAQRLPRERALVLASFRAASASSAPALIQSLVNENAGRSVQRLQLSRLRPSEVIALVQAEPRGASSPAELGRLLWQKSEGLPLFAARLLRAVMEEAESLAMSKGEPGAAPPQVLVGCPASVTGFIRQQLARLAEPERALLDVAAVLGDEFHVTTVARVLELNEDDVERALAAIEQNHQLVLRRGEEEHHGRTTVCFRFCHALVQEEVYDLLAAQRRIALHGVVARALCPATVGPDASQRGDQAYDNKTQAALAFHLERARDFAGATLAWLRAGDYCDRRFAKQEAVPHYERARALLPKVPVAEQVLYRLLIAQSLGWAKLGLGELESARLEFRTAGQCGRELESRECDASVRAAWERSQAYLSVEWEDPLLRRLTPMLPERATASACTLRAEAYFGECVVLARVERYHELLEVAAELLALSRRAHNQQREVEALAWLGSAHLEVGRTKQAKSLLEACLALSSSLGYSRGVDMSCFGRARLHALQGELEPAAAYFQALCERTVLSHRAAVCHVELGDIHAKQGRIRSALSHHHAALELRRGALGERAASHSGWICRELGAPRRALELDSQALEYCSGDEPERTRFFSYSIAQSYARLRDVQRARDVLAGVAVPGTLKDALLNRQHEWVARCEIHATAEEYEELGGLAAEWHQAAEAHGAPESLLRARCFMSESALGVGDLDGARDQVRAALELYQESPLPLLGIQLFGVWQRVAERRGQRGAAERARKALSELYEQIAPAIDDAALRGCFQRRLRHPGSARDQE